jgi:hypothetical protein
MNDPHYPWGMGKSVQLSTVEQQKIEQWIAAQHAAAGGFALPHRHVRRCG